jgi:hypothetical protein
MDFINEIETECLKKTFEAAHLIDDVKHKIADIDVMVERGLKAELYLTKLILSLNHRAYEVAPLIDEIKGFLNLK